VILVDDGLATGFNPCGLRCLSSPTKSGSHRRRRARLSAQTCDEYRMGVDEIICAKTPEPFMESGFGTKSFRRQLMRRFARLLKKAQADHGA